MIEIYSAEICPFAQRTRALMNKIDVPYQLHEIDLSDKPKQFLEVSPTGKVPLLVDDDFVLYESQIINDYLIDKYSWSGAYSDQIQLRYRQKLMMKQWDSTVLDPFYRCLGHGKDIQEYRDELQPELEQFQKLIISIDKSTDNILAFHVATFWLRMKWLREYSDFPALVKEYDRLYEWLNEATSEAPIQNTKPDRGKTIHSYEENYID